VCLAALGCGEVERTHSPAQVAKPVAVEAPPPPVDTRAAPPGLCEWDLRDGVPWHPSYGAARTEATRVDLDGDALGDLVASLEGCGNWGDCMFVVLQGCPDQLYRAVWGPEYAQSIEVGARASGAPIAGLVIGGRTALAGCDLPLQATVTWDGDSWTEPSWCAQDGGVWDASCGPRPPACGRR
jgi:hypothetical protein